MLSRPLRAGDVEPVPVYFVDALGLCAVRHDYGPRPTSASRSVCEMAALVNPVA